MIDQVADSRPKHEVGTLVDRIAEDASRDGWKSNRLEAMLVGQRQAGPGTAWSLPCGPTAWMTCLALRLPPPVIAASPTGQRPIWSHSRWIDGPPRMRIAPATPDPSCKYWLAALTTASTSRSVMSPSTSRSTLLLTVISITCLLKSETRYQKLKLSGSGPIRFPLSNASSAFISS